MLVNNFLLSRQAACRHWKVEEYVYGKLQDTYWVDLDKAFKANATMSPNDGEIFRGWATPESIAYCTNKNDYKEAAFILPGSEIYYNEKYVPTSGFDNGSSYDRRNSLLFSKDEQKWSLQTLKLYAVFGVPGDKFYNLNSPSNEINITSQGYYDFTQDCYFQISTEPSMSTYNSTSYYICLYNSDGIQKEILYPQVLSKTGYLFFAQAGESLSVFKTNSATTTKLKIINPQIPYTYRFEVK